MNNVHFVLDEAALLGNMSAIDDALGIGRGYGIRLQVYYQSIGQLKKSFPDGQEQTLFSNTTQIFFGVNDNATAECVSTRIGEETIEVDSGGTSSSRSYQSSNGANPSDTSGTTRSWNSNWQLQPRKLLKPEEAIALPPRIALTFTPGVRPIMTQLIRFYEEKSLFRQRSVWRRRFGPSVALARLVVFSVLSFLFAACMTPPFARALKGLPPFEQQESVNDPSTTSGDHYVGHR